MEVSGNKLEMKMKHLSKHKNYDAMKRMNENKQGLRSEKGFETFLAAVRVTDNRFAHSKHALSSLRRTIKESKKQDKS